jgi:threonine aldolase
LNWGKNKVKLYKKNKRFNHHEIIMNKKSFASDNYAGIHGDILNSIIEANQGHAIAYGEDDYTKSAVEIFKEHFGADVSVYFVTTGTAANVLGLSLLLKPYQSILCAESAHINVDEAGALENYTGSKLLTIKTIDGKITVKDIEHQLSAIGNQHKTQPKVVSITQGTELGTVYTPEEIKNITDFAHAHEMYVHMDGARLSNAAAALNVSLAALTGEVGIDLLSFGGTKNGMMLGEAVIFFNKVVANDFQYIRKQGMQLVSKMRFISTQFIALLSNDLWRKNALHANAMAKLLEKLIAEIPQIKISRPVTINAVFAYVNPMYIPVLQEKYSFYVWDESTSEVRWMTSFDTSEEDVIEFVNHIKHVVNN